MRWKWGFSASPKDDAGATDRPETQHVDLVEALETRGMARAFAERLAPRIDAARHEHGDAGVAALVDGAVTSYKLQTQANEELEANLRDLRELERMLGAFSGELSKLDEVLEVLAAYVRRMRTSTPTQAPSTLH